MDRYVSVRTPESIAFSYELAGLGSRFLAVAADMAIQVLLVLAIFWGIALAAGTAAPPSRTEMRLTESLALALVIAIVFAVFFGYFILFEAFWNGQTPGKRLLGLRVVRDGGYPVDMGAATIRNLIRVGEFGFGFYAISAAAAILSKENKRLGDMAAGTIVVREAKPATLESIVARSQSTTDRVQSITEEEHALIDRFVNRREGLERHVRADIAAKLAQRIRPRVPYDLQRLDDEELLERVSAS